MNQALLDELLLRDASFAILNQRGYLYSRSATMVTVSLNLEEAAKFAQMRFAAETKRLSQLRCTYCHQGHIVESSMIGRAALRYSCTCDGKDPIKQSEWVPLRVE